jgi:hypothetical protein
MSEQSEQENRGQVPGPDSREDEQECSERSEKHGPKLRWLDVIGPYFEAAAELLGFLQHL